MDPTNYAGHSLRAGFCTSAAEHGASVWKMMDVSRHKSVDTLPAHLLRLSRQTAVPRIPLLVVESAS